MVCIVARIEPHSTHQVLPGAAEAVQVGSVGILQHGRDEATVGQGDGHGDVDILVVLDAIRDVASVHNRVLGKGHSDGLGEQSRDGDALALDLT